MLRTDRQNESRHHADRLESTKHLLGTLRRGWQLIAISSVICLTLAVIYLARARREYQATTRLLVLQQGSRPLNVAANDGGRAADAIEDYLPTHAMIVRSPVVVSRAIDAVGLELLPSLVNAKAGPIAEAIDRLSASRPDRAAKVLGISYRANSPEEAVRMVGAILASYEKFVEESYRKNNNDIVSLILKAREELKTELGKIEQEYLEFRQSNLQLSTDDSGRTFAARRLDHWDRAANEAMLKEVLIRSQLDLGRELQRKGAGLWAVAHAMTQIGGDSGGGVLGNMAAIGQGASSEYVRQLAQEQQQLAERYGPHYTKVREIQEQMVRIQERQRESRNRVDSLETRDLLEAIGQSLASIGAMRLEIGKRLDSDLVEAKRAETLRFAEASLRDKLDRHRSLFNTVVEQLKQAQFVSDYGTITTQTIEPPNALKTPVRPLVSLILFTSLVAGIGLGVAAALVSDQLDQRLHSIRDIREVLTMPQIGQIPQIRSSENTTSTNPGLFSLHMPHSPQAEAYRAIRTALELLRRHQHVKVILVTSPLSGDGKSTCASNLAITLAQSGRKVLLVDSDLRRPTQNMIHSARNDRGLIDILRDDEPIHRVVKATEVTGLDLITSGRQVSNPADLLTSARLPEFLTAARQDYDVVIIDAPPILSVADTAIVGALVDGILLIVRAKRLKRHHVERTLELLKSIDTLVLGAIVNGASMERNAYSYSYKYTVRAPEPDDSPECEPSVNVAAHAKSPDEAIG